MTRYCLIENYDDVLRFRDGLVRITFRADEDDCWKLYAVRDDDPSRRCELMRRPTMMEWNRTRFDGFEVPTGSPADKIMQALVRLGQARLLEPGQQGPGIRPLERPLRYH